MSVPESEMKVVSSRSALEKVLLAMRFLSEADEDNPIKEVVLVDVMVLPTIELSSAEIRDSDAASPFPLL